MKIEILDYTKKPLTRIGTNASYCYNTKLKDEEHPKRIAISCIKDGHGRNMEFADVTIKISGVSTRMMREMGRHCVGTSYVQASTRYITYKEFDYYTPQGMTQEQEQVYHDAMKSIQEYYGRLKELGCKNDTSGYLLPLAMDTEVVFKLNVRAIEHMFHVRECTRALKEFRDFMKLFKSELAKLDDEWEWLCNNVFMAKCKHYGYCDEGRGCGLYPKKENVIGINNI